MLLNSLAETLSIILLIILIVPTSNYFVPQFLYAVKTPKLPSLKDQNLSTEIVFKGKFFPTGMAFLSAKDILVIDKESGKVFRIVNGQKLDAPLLDVNVANVSERGLLGIAVANNTNNSKSASMPYVFLYYTETKDRDGGEVLGNRLYRYELVDNRLVNPKLLLNLPTKPGPSHDGGVLKIGPDKKSIYLVIGDLNRLSNASFFTQAQNIEFSGPPDGRGGILRVTFDGKVVGGHGIFGEDSPLNKYFGYGLRNSFGIAFDPITGNLWDTENGANFGDEINLVEPGFNGGWRQVEGMAYLNDLFDPQNLVTFDGKGKYSDPEFEWMNTTGPTSITFLNSIKLGKQYENDMFVGNINGTLHHFDLLPNRSALALTGVLSDKVANTNEELKDVVLGQGFGLITDLETGPDGYLYVLSFYYRNTGIIYRIVPSNGNISQANL
jgi:glucose/arabinose dehydrogenase